MKKYKVTLAIRGYFSTEVEIPDFDQYSDEAYDNALDLIQDIAIEGMGSTDLFNCCDFDIAHMEEIK